MADTLKATIKTYFETGDFPSESEFVNLIDSCYNGKGWAIYQDDLTIASIALSVTPVKLTVNGSGANTNTDYLPVGSTALWDTTNNKILPMAVGDSYDTRLDFTITEKLGVATGIIVQLDIGGGATPTNVILTKFIPFYKSAPYYLSESFPTYSLATFIANGGQLFISTDGGTATLTSRSVFIKKDYSAI